MKTLIKPTSEQRHQVNDLVLHIQKLLEGKDWVPSLAVLTICSLVPCWAKQSKPISFPVNPRILEAWAYSTQKTWRCHDSCFDRHFRASHSANEFGLGEYNLNSI
jgi:hypothetical protein